MVDFEPINTKDKSVQYRLKVKTERNDSRLNNHQPIQLLGWCANCDIQIIIDHHSCVEYLSKYAAKGEPQSPMLKDTFNSVINHDDSSPFTKVIKRLMMKSIGERDFSAQETMHLLLSLNLHSSNLKVVPINLNGSSKIQTNLSSEHKCTQDSLLDVYAKREVHQKNLTDIIQMNFITFAANHKVSKGKLVEQSANVVPRIFPNYSPNPNGDKYGLYCKYQLLMYKPWSGSK